MNNTFTEGFELHKQGKLDEAIEIYRKDNKDIKCMLNLVSLLSIKQDKESKKEAKEILNTINLIECSGLYKKMHMYDEELLELIVFWYNSPTFYKKQMTQQSLLEQWINLWFAKGEKQKEVDDYLKLRFSNIFNKKFISCNIHTDIALIILYDQITRNIFRNTKKAYEFDNIALNIAKKYVNNINFMSIINVQYVITLTICLIHSENIEDQNLACLIVEKMLIQHKYYYSEIFTLLKKICQNHKMRIDLFGRIPERNIFIGRNSTSEEKAFLNSL
jgi:uncharacterized protein (DUF924 family)